MAGVGSNDPNSNDTFDVPYAKSLESTYDRSVSLSGKENYEGNFLIKKIATSTPNPNDMSWKTALSNVQNISDIRNLQASNMDRKRQNCVTMECDNAVEGSPEIPRKSVHFDSAGSIVGSDYSGVEADVEESFSGMTSGDIQSYCESNNSMNQLRSARGDSFREESIRKSGFQMKSTLDSMKFMNSKSSELSRSKSPMPSGPKSKEASIKPVLSELSLGKSHDMELSKQGDFKSPGKKLPESVKFSIGYEGVKSEKNQLTTKKIEKKCNGNREKNSAEAFENGVMVDTEKIKSGEESSSNAADVLSAVYKDMRMDEILCTALNDLKVKLIKSSMDSFSEMEDYEMSLVSRLEDLLSVAETYKSRLLEEKRCYQEYTRSLLSALDVSNTQNSAD